MSLGGISQTWVTAYRHGSSRRATDQVRAGTGAPRSMVPCSRQVGSHDALRMRGEASPSGWFVIRLVARELPRPELSLIFADMISNLRATPRSPHLGARGGARRAQIRVPGALAPATAEKDPPVGLQSRISMRRVAPDLLPCVQMSRTGCSAMAARRAESMAVSFLGRDEYEARS
jgi:hypothetical protein